MSGITNIPHLEGDYAWELATLYPPQGHWSEEDYLSLTDSTNRRIEFVDGCCLEFLPMPTVVHQVLVRYLFRLLDRFVIERDLGEVHFAGLRIRSAESIRLPDLVFLHRDHQAKANERLWEGADLAVEVVSEDAKDRKRDYEEKLVEYAAGGISEYWIVDPQQRVVIVHRLDGDSYQVHGMFKEGDQATSVLLKGFSANVTDLFAEADNVAG